MWSIFSLCLFVNCVFCAEENISNNSTNPLFESRIIGGYPANIADHPHQIALIYNGKFLCGGSLIAWNWGLTAAHACYGIKTTQLQIRAGSKYWDRLGILTSISQLFIHPKYNPQSVSHDSCVMKLEESLESYVKYDYSIALIGLATSIPLAKTNAVLAGWGLTSMTSGTPERLQAATLQLVERNKCSQSYNLDISKFCAGKWEGGLSFCFGDSGGGLKYNGELIGTVSYGAKVCAKKFYPGVFCNIPVVRTWILDTINAN